MLEIEWEGTMTGPWGDTPGTGRHQTTRAAWLLTFTGDAISIIHGSEWSGDAFMQQLGLLPQPAGVA